MGSPTSTGTAFNTLASYLFGSNSRRESMAMTTPVEIRKGGADSYTMSFFMPSKFSTSNAPPPSDDRVTLTDLPTEILAAKDFPGGWGQGLEAEVEAVEGCLPCELKP